MVQRRHFARGTGRLFAGAGMYRISARRIRDLGGAARRAGPAHQAHRRAQRLLPAVHPAKLYRQRGPARGGFLAGAGRGHAWRRQRAGGTADRASDLGNDHQLYVRAVDPFPSRPAANDQSMVQRGALGDAHADVPAHHRIPLAGGAYGPRHTGRGGGGDADDSGGLPHVLRGGFGNSADLGPQERGRAFCRRGRDLHYRGSDGRRARAAMRHLALPGAELRARV